VVGVILIGHPVRAGPSDGDKAMPRRFEGGPFHALPVQLRKQLQKQFLVVGFIF
jgi:hypothetical protein